MSKHIQDDQEDKPKKKAKFNPNEYDVDGDQITT